MNNKTKPINIYNLFLKYGFFTSILILIELPIWSLVLIILYVSPLAIITSKVTNLHTKFFLKLFRINVKYNFNQQNKSIHHQFVGNMFIANHISWIDILAMLNIYNRVSFIAKAGLKKWPILGKAIIKHDTIFVQQSRSELKKVNSQIAQQITTGKSVAVFPEGETTNGKTVYQFKSAIFQSAIDAECFLIPIVINYLDKHGDNIAPEITYNNKNLIQSIKDTIYKAPFTVEVTELQAINTSHFANRNELRDYVQQEIKNYYLKVIT